MSVGWWWINRVVEGNGIGIGFVECLIYLIDYLLRGEGIFFFGEYCKDIEDRVLVDVDVVGMEDRENEGK